MCCIALFAIVALSISFILGISFVHRIFFSRKSDLDLSLQIPVVIFAILNLTAIGFTQLTKQTDIADILHSIAWLVLVLQVYLYPQYLYAIFQRPFKSKTGFITATVFFELLYMVLHVISLDRFFFVTIGYYSSVLLVKYYLTFHKELDQLHSQIKQQFIGSFLHVNLFLALTLLVSSTLLLIKPDIKIATVITSPLLIYMMIMLYITSRAYVKELLLAKENRASVAQIADFARKYSLTLREQEILDHVVAKKKNSEIAQILSISIHTVKSHMQSMYNKTGINSKSGLTQLVYEHQ